MKKIQYFAIFTIFLAISACTLPKQIEITGVTPKFKFSVDTSLNKLILDLFEDSFGDDSEIKIMDCTAIPDVQTYLLYMKALEESFEADAEVPTTFMFNGVEMKLYSVKFDTDMPLYNSESNLDEPIILPLENLEELFDGFSFNPDGIKAKLFLTSNNDIVNDLNIDIEFVAIDSDKNEIDPGNPVRHISIPKPGTKIESAPSGIIFETNEYADENLPDWGEDIDDFSQLLNAKKDLKVKIKVILPARTEILVSVLETTVTVSAELVILLPLAFEAAEGAEIVFPRDSLKEAGEYVDTVANALNGFSLVIGMTNNPFSGTSLILRQPGTTLEIINPLGTQSASLSLSTADMDKIIKLGRDFNPDVSIKFDEARNVVFPRDLGITTIHFDAKIRYTIDLL